RSLRDRALVEARAASGPPGGGVGVEGRTIAHRVDRLGAEVLLTKTAHVRRPSPPAPSPPGRGGAMLAPPQELAALVLCPRPTAPPHRRRSRRRRSAGDPPPSRRRFSRA